MLSAEQIRARLQARFERFVMPEPNSGCWLWMGVVRNSGYGLIGVGSSRDGTRTMRSAHKVAHELFIGQVPAGAIVRHKCDVRICVNPDHLVVGTQAQNIADMVARGRNFWGRQTHCKNGHGFTPANTRTRPDGGRRCVACARAASKRHYQRHKPC